MHSRGRSIFNSAMIFAKEELRQRLFDGVLGFSWLFLLPGLQLLVFYFVFVEMFQQRSGVTQNYLVFLALGFWPWLAFSETVLRGTALFLEKSVIAKKVRFSKLGMFFGVSLTTFAFHLVGFVCVLVLFLFFGVVDVSIYWLLLPLLWVLHFLFALCIGLIASIVNVFIRDTTKFVGLVMTLWFFTTPIFYPASALPTATAGLQIFNPIASVVQLNRIIVQGGSLAESILPTIIVIFATSLLAAFVYGRTSVELEEFS